MQSAFTAPLGLLAPNRARRGTSYVVRYRIGVEPLLHLIEDEWPGLAVTVPLLLGSEALVGECQGCLVGVLTTQFHGDGRFGSFGATASGHPGQLDQAAGYQPEEPAIVRVARALVFGLKVEWLTYLRSHPEVVPHRVV